MKTLNVKNIYKSVYTKAEIRYCKDHDWNLTTEAGRDCFVREGDFWNGTWVLPSTNKEKFLKETKKRSTYLRKKINDEFERRNRDKWNREYYKDELTLDAWYEKRLAADKKAMLAKREQQRFNAMVKADNVGIKKHLSLSFISSVYDLLNSTIKIGSNVDSVKAEWSKENGVICSEGTYWKKYTSRESWPVTTRNFILTIRKGWHAKSIAGVLTFVKGDKIEREGMACEWIEQGKSIASIRTVKGFLVRGEHIEAKTLREAQAINAEHRAKQLASLIASRKRDEKKRVKEASLMITFEDSLASGNCRPGTQSFKDKYEREIGHEATYITASDLRKYAKKFGVSYYAERVINHMMNH